MGRKMRTKEIEFTITCYLSDAQVVEDWLKRNLREVTFEQALFQREVTDREVPIGYWVKATFDY